MTKALYYEVQISKSGVRSYLFTKRLNSKQGIFPGFKDKFKKKLATANESEARTEALRLSNELEYLQQVSFRDCRGHILTLKELSRAADTWFGFIMQVNLKETLEQAAKHTKEGFEAREYLKILKDDICDGFNQRKFINGVGVEWLTPFGDTLLSRLEGASTFTPFSEAGNVYLRQRQRDHLPSDSKTVRDITRNIEYFVGIAGDKPIEQIIRKDVEKYISIRLGFVKTTSVEREIGALSAVWQQCSFALDINQQNPFARQPIKALGTDSVKRPTPSLTDTQILIAMLDARHKRLPGSYISPMVMVATLTGLRLNEVWGLEHADYIRAAEGETNGILHIRTNDRRNNLKTTNSTRPFPVLPELEKWIEILLKASRPKNANSASSAILAALKREGFTFGNHSLRHGFKQRLVEIDTPTDTIDELCGWGAQRMQDRYGFKTVTAKKAKIVKEIYAALFETQLNLTKTSPL